MNPLIGILFCAFGQAGFAQIGLPTFEVGKAEVDIAQPMGYPLTGYYYKIFSIGKKDLLKEKALFFCQGTTLPAIITCDLSGVARGLSDSIREAISQNAQILVILFGISGSYSHTAPDSLRDHYSLLAKTPYPSGKRRYAQNLVGPMVSLLGLVQFSDSIIKKPIGIVPNFALQPDMASGLECSADYPCFREKAARKSLGIQTISHFVLGVCGNINQGNPFGETVNKTSEICRTLFKTVHSHLPMEKRDLRLAQKLLEFPIRSLGEGDLDRAIKALDLLKAKGRLNFLPAPGPLNLELVLNENGRLFKELWG